MSWEWLAPVGTVVGAGITAGFGGWLGGRRSQREQEKQHRFEREKAITDHSRDKIDAAIGALRFLEKHSALVVKWRESGHVVDDLQRELSEQLDHVGRVIAYLVNVNTRRDIKLVHDVIRFSYGIQLFATVEIESPQKMILIACREGLGTLGRSLREEPWEFSENLASLWIAYHSALKAYLQEEESNKAYEADVKVEADSAKNIRHSKSSTDD